MLRTGETPTRTLQFLAASAFGALVFLAPTSARAAGLQEFGRCLAREGAIFYGASWCPHCRSQRQLLGEAMSGVRYVECSTDGGRGTTSSACTSAKVDSFPTWVFSNGARANGVQSLTALAARTGCTLPSAAASDGGDAKRPSHPSGPKIIEVPQ